LFSITCHPQTDGQTIDVNMTLSTMLRVVLKKNIKMWEECLPHVEFAYNRSLHCTTKMCPVENVYGFLPRAPIDLMSLPSSKKLNFDATQRAELMLELHETTFPHSFIGCYGREIGYRPTDRSAIMLWIGTGALFSGAVDPFNSVDDYAKGCHVRAT
jgi:hypothetical protein